MILGLKAHLAALAASGQITTYGALAKDLSLPGPGTIARLTEALESLMAEDAAAGRPFRAALCAGRLNGGLPAPGFFEAAVRLRRYAGAADGPEAIAFVAAERAALFGHC